MSLSEISSGGQMSIGKISTGGQMSAPKISSGGQMSRLHIQLGGKCPLIDLFIGGGGGGGGQMSWNLLAFKARRSTHNGQQTLTDHNRSP